MERNFIPCAHYWLNATALRVGLRAFMDAEHAWYIGTVDVGIEVSQCADLSLRVLQRGWR